MNLTNKIKKQVRTQLYNEVVRTVHDQSAFFTVHLMVCVDMGNNIGWDVMEPSRFYLMNEFNE
jgi:hypothetical protein